MQTYGLWSPLNTLLAEDCMMYYDTYMLDNIYLCMYTFHLHKNIILIYFKVLFMEGTLYKKKDYCSSIPPPPQPTTTTTTQLTVLTLYENIYVLRTNADSVVYWIHILTFNEILVTNWGWSWPRSEISLYEHIFFSLYWLWRIFSGFYNLKNSSRHFKF